MTKLLKHIPHKQARIIPIEPVFLTLPEAQKYTGMEDKLFRKTAREYGLRTYANGPKKIWHKKEDLDKMMESFLIIDNKKTLSAN